MHPLSPLELHNGNVYILVFWRGRLMRLDDAPSELCVKHYNRYTGKTLNVYSWTLLKWRILHEIERLDKEFKKSARKKRKQTE